MMQHEGEEKVDFGAMFDEATTETSPTPAPTAESQPPVVAEPETPEVAPEPQTRVRDEHGRFTTKQDAPAVEAAPETPVPPTPQTPAPPVEVPAPDLSKYQPFEYTAVNRRHRLDGAVMDESGAAYFPKPAVERLTRLLADAHEAGNLRSQQGRIRSEAVREGEEMMQRANLMVRRMDEALMSGEPGSEAWEKAVLDFAYGWAQKRPLIDAEARAQIAEENRKKLEQQIQEREKESQQAELIPKKYAAIDEWTQKLAAQHGFAAADITKLRDRYRSPEWFEQLFEEQNGEVVIVYEKIDRDLGYMKQFYRPAPSPAPRPSAPPPPVVSSRGAPSPTPRKPVDQSRKTVRERDKEVFEEAFNE